VKPSSTFCEDPDIKSTPLFYDGSNDKRSTVASIFFTCDCTGFYNLIGFYYIFTFFFGSSSSSELSFFFLVITGAFSSSPNIFYL
jgi:hypothetical protein